MITILFDKPTTIYECDRYGNKQKAIHTTSFLDNKHFIELEKAESIDQSYIVDDELGHIITIRADGSEVIYKNQNYTQRYPMNMLDCESRDTVHNVDMLLTRDADGEYISSVEEQELKEMIWLDMRGDSRVCELTSNLLPVLPEINQGEQSVSM